MNDETPDWRIGLTVKPRRRNHELYYEYGNVIDVMPHGTGGIFDRTGVLKIKMESGRVIISGADDWITA